LDRNRGPGSLWCERSSGIHQEEHTSCFRAGRIGGSSWSCL